MRVTLTFDPDIAVELERRCRGRNHSLDQQVNDLIRVGLIHVEQEQPTAAAFRVEPLDIGEPLVDSFDDISAALEGAEGQNYR